MLGTATVGRVVGGSAVMSLPLTDSKIIAGASTVAVFGLGILATSPTVPFRTGLPVVVMFAVSLPFGAIYNIASDAATTEGSALAMVIAVGNLVALMLPIITGSIRDSTGGYEGAFFLLVGLNTLAIGSAVLITRIHQ